jgi:hypothetical protein
MQGNTLSTTGLTPASTNPQHNSLIAEVADFFVDTFKSAAKLPFGKPSFMTRTFSDNEINPPSVDPIALKDKVLRCDATYTNESNTSQATDLDALAKEQGYTHVSDIEHGSMRAIIFANDEKMSVAFRGTEVCSTTSTMIQNALYNLNYTSQEHPIAAGAEVQKGFHDALHEKVDGNSFIDNIVERMQAIQASVQEQPGDENKQLSVELTGHSLGGALSILAAQELTDKGFNITNITAVAPPPVGNAAFTEAYNNEFGEITTTLISMEDTIALSGALNPKTRLHVGTSVEISPSPAYDLIVDDTPLTSSSFADLINSDPKVHSTDMYLESLDKAAQNPQYTMYAAAKSLGAQIMDDTPNTTSQKDNNLQIASVISDLGGRH